MPIPPTANPTGLSIHPVPSNRWEATCGKCLKTSIRVPAVDASHAWVDLQRLGWIHHVSQYGGIGYAVCEACAEKPVSDGTKAARRKRR